VRQLLRGGFIQWVGGSPLIDSRGILGIPGLRELVVGELVAHVGREHDVVAGVANSGVPWAILVAGRLHLPFANVLVDGPRVKGLSRRLEPADGVSGKRVLVIDNWLETGASMRVACEILDQHGAAHIVPLTIAARLEGTRREFPRPLHVAFPVSMLLNSIITTSGATLE
jgi:orotate phosphoribosyltransferase